MRGKVLSAIAALGLLGSIFLLPSSALACCSGSDFIGTTSTDLGSGVQHTDTQIRWYRYEGQTHQGGYNNDWSWLNFIPWVHINGSTGNDSCCTVGGTNGWNVFAGAISGTASGWAMALFTDQDVSGTKWPKDIIASCATNNGGVNLSSNAWYACTGTTTGQKLTDSYYWLAIQYASPSHNGATTVGSPACQNILCDPAAHRQFFTTTTTATNIPTSFDSTWMSLATADYSGWAPMWVHVGN